MAVCSVNSAIGPQGLWPILLVFDVIPRPARLAPSTTKLDRASVIYSVISEVEKVQARRRITFGLRHTGGQKRVEAYPRAHQSSYFDPPRSAGRVLSSSLVWTERQPWFRRGRVGAYFDELRETLLGSRSGPNNPRCRHEHIRKNRNNAG